MKVRKIRTNLPVAGEDGGSRSTQTLRQRDESGKLTVLMSYHTQAEVHVLPQPQSMPCLVRAAVFQLFLLIFISPLFLLAGCF